MATEEFTISAKYNLKDIEKLIAQYQDYTYPLTITFTNLMPFDTVYPAVNLFLKYSFVGDGRAKATLDIASYNSLNALACDIWQVATMNNNQDGVKFEFAEQNLSKNNSQLEKTEKTKLAEVKDFAKNSQAKAEG